MSDKQMVDKNSMRSGAGLSAVVILIGFIFQGAVGVVAVVSMLLALGVGSLAGLRFSPLGAIYRAGKRAFKLSIPVEPEPGQPPRFAQTLGFVFLSLAALSFAAFGAGSVVGWTLALLVAGLQGLLAVTGLCVGCEIYLYTRRFAAKGA